MFTALLRAAALRSVGIVHRGERWEVWVHAGQTLAESACEAIHTTPGEVRQWSTFEEAYAFVRNQGYRGTVEVEDVSEAAGDRANAMLAAAAEPLPAPQEVVPAVAGPERPKANGNRDGRSPLAVTTPPKKSTTTPTKATPSRRALSGLHPSTRPGTRPAPKAPPG